MNAIGASLQVRALADGNDVVLALAELAGDLGRQVLVEQQLQPEIASRAARQLTSARSLSASMRAMAHRRYARGRPVFGAARCYRRRSGRVKAGSPGAYTGYYCGRW